MLSYHSREERRKIHEHCFWSLSDSNEIVPGIILNESATGVLLQTDCPLSQSKPIWILSLPMDDPLAQNLSPANLINHPLTRPGKIVRLAMNHCYGIQFDPETGERPQYQRWYRGKSTVTTLIDGQRASITLGGALNFESAVLLERLFTKPANPLNEILFSCHKVDQVNGMAFKVVQMALKQCEKNGIVITIISGNETHASFEKKFSLEQGFLLNVQSFPTENQPETVLSPPSFSNLTSKPDSEGVVILTRGIADLNRLSTPLERLKIITWKTQNYKEGPDLIANKHPRFVIVDFELDHCPLLLEINRIRKYNLMRIPPLMVIGPPHLGELIKEALALPVKLYLTKPCTDREYINGLQTMLSEEYKNPKLT